MEGGWPHIAFMQVGKCMLVILRYPNWQYENQEEGMTFVERAQEILFSNTDNVHSTHINAKDQGVSELNNPITPWTIWKKLSRYIFSNQTVHQIMWLQEMWCEVIVTLKNQYDGITGRSEKAKRQHLTLIQLWSSSSFPESIGLYIWWNYRAPFVVCI